MHKVFPPAPHGELSVCDNNLFGIAKKMWRAERDKACGNDFTKQALYLLWCMNWVTPEAVRKAYVKNFLLDVKQPSLKLCDERLGQSNRLTFKNQTRQWDYIKAYKMWLQDDKAIQEQQLESLEDGLDGVYWK